MYIDYHAIDNFYDRVRSLLSTNDDIISDEAMDYPEKAPMAEEIIKIKVPNWAELSDEQTVIFEKAIVLQTALIVYPQVSHQEYKIKQTTSMKVEYRDPSQGLDIQLKTMLDTLIGQLVPASSGTDFIGFEIT